MFNFSAICWCKFCCKLIWFVGFLIIYFFVFSQSSNCCPKLLKILYNDVFFEHNAAVVAVSFLCALLNNNNRQYSNSNYIKNTNSGPEVTFHSFCPGNRDTGHSSMLWTWTIFCKIWKEKEISSHNEKKINSRNSYEFLLSIIFIMSGSKVEQNGEFFQRL